MTTKEQQGSFGLLLMLSWYLLRRLRVFLQRPFRLSLKAPLSGLSMQVERQPSDGRQAPTTEPSEMPTTDDENSIARKTVPSERDSTIKD